MVIQFSTISLGGIGRNRTTVRRRVPWSLCPRPFARMKLPLGRHQNGCLFSAGNAAARAIRFAATNQRCQAGNREQREFVSCRNGCLYGAVCRARPPTGQHFGRIELLKARISSRPVNMLATSRGWRARDQAIVQNRNRRHAQQRAMHRADAAENAAPPSTTAVMANTRNPCPRRSWPRPRREV